MDLRAHLEALAYPRHPQAHPDGHARARAYVRSVLQRFGPVHEQPFWSIGGRGTNLWIDLGSAGNEQPVLVGAHYDTVPFSPGADDNAGGVAALLELARRAADSPPPRPLRLAAFDLEEAGMFGGRAMARALRCEGRPLHVMLSLEMIGFRSRTPGSQRYPPFVGRGRPDTGNFIALVANGRARAALDRLARAMPVPVQTLVAPLGGWPVPATRQSDHSPFWDRGYPAIMLTDTAWLRNPHYHLPSDTLDTLDLDFLGGVLDGIWNFLRAP